MGSSRVLRSRDLVSPSLRWPEKGRSGRRERRNIQKERERKAEKERKREERERHEGEKEKALREEKRKN